LAFEWDQFASFSPAEVDPFGFSWLAAVSWRGYLAQGLGGLGFFWILSSESRLFNGLRGLDRGRISFSAFPARERRGNRPRRGLGMTKAGLFMRQLNLSSDFPQEIVVPNVPFRSPPAEGKRRLAEYIQPNG
jgi:hypothetical protein